MVKIIRFIALAIAVSAPLALQAENPNSIFRGIEKTINQQTEQINSDCEFNNGSTWHPNLLPVPSVCLEAFLNALKPKWNDRKKTLVFQEQGRKYRNGDDWSSTPYTLYPLYNNVDWDQLLTQRYLLIQYSISTTGLKLRISLRAAILSKDGTSILRCDAYYNFYLSLRPYKFSKEQQDQRIEELKEKIKNNPDLLIDENSMILPDWQTERQYGWKLHGVFFDKGFRPEYKPTGNTEESIFRH